MASLSVPPQHVPLYRSSEESLRGIAYENTTAAKPPIPITLPSKPPSNKHINRLKHPRSPSSPKARSRLNEDARRDSGLAPSTSSSFRDSRTTLDTDVNSLHRSVRPSTSLPSFHATPPLEAAKAPNSKARAASGGSQLSASPTLPQLPSISILTEIPTSSFEDLTNPGQLEFSKRGSMLLGGKKAIVKREDTHPNGRLVGSRRGFNLRSPMSPAMSLPTRVLSADDEALSNKVRSMYEDGGADNCKMTAKPPHAMNGHTNGHPNGQTDPSINPSVQIIGSDEPNANDPGLQTVVRKESLSTRQQIHNLLLSDTELAGGIEDWEDINNGDVDRYGFILPRRISSHPSSLSSHRPQSAEPPQLQRMSTLQLASERPRRERGRLASHSRSPARSTGTHSSSDMRHPSGNGNFRPNSSQSSYRSTSGNSTRKLRAATNRLPHNKDRRCVDEAGDMLTLPPGLADIAEDEEHATNPALPYDLRTREVERDEKWRKMAKIVRVPPNSQSKASTTPQHGGGMSFTFDTTSPKLIERTWKGIPDKWRATAWHAFLTSSCSRHPRRKSLPTDSHLRTAFLSLLSQPSPDDVQIDLDVPRTINSHIMFRRRYRGGQRLLFRVLHVMSLYFPDTGYVQGMAAIAATLLCYYDEEMAFVMLVRMWQLRGLEQLYRAGFAGLMGALEEFEKSWLGGANKRDGEVKRKLEELGITSTAYGTRWYLTLFNYSIPFPAQLRVWDVFMLLGDPDVAYPVTTTTDSASSTIGETSNTNGTADMDLPAANFHHGLDVLHAVSAALVDGTRAILLDSDFENAMKVLTSWIPVRDEELLMKVARVEWKMKRRKASAR